MFSTALKLFTHTLASSENRVSTVINSGLMALVDQDLIEATSQTVSDALDAGERVWLTSDLHFLHTNIIKYCDRPFFDVGSMTDALIATLQKVPDDELIIFVGDMAMGCHQKTVELIRLLPGRKILIAGNHDIASDGECKLANEKNLFEVVVPFLAWQGYQRRLVVVSHYPIIVPETYKNTPVLNYHGHLHEKTLPLQLMIKYMNVGWDINQSLNCL
ncbi:metallophosphoesterase [Rhodoferax sp.]|uniref:metallophosphoesterase n=1 Tax=Rhodoferax sp. TaxID=50421 RepID=UPI0026193D66|nr:metallophosphoesterase [Rhodoferax sp.]MDD2811157.1 metallophosphoesterase [Rhodoferax sp.]MDD4943717.1 metallophosphoesterase [Rhodoferax sp.]